MKLEWRSVTYHYVIQGREEREAPNLRGSVGTDLGLLTLVVEICNLVVHIISFDLNNLQHFGNNI
jgi:hypothetical protein